MRSFRREVEERKREREREREGKRERERESKKGKREIMSFYEIFSEGGGGEKER